jgi:hypothetical protein
MAMSAGTLWVGGQWLRPLFAARLLMGSPKPASFRFDAPMSNWIPLHTTPAAGIYNRACHSVARRAHSLPHNCLASFLGLWYS